MKIKKTTSLLTSVALLLFNFLSPLILRGSIHAAPNMSATFVDSSTIRLTIGGDTFGNLKSSNAGIYAGEGALVQGLVNGNSRCGMFISIFVPPNGNTAGVTLTQPRTLNSIGNGTSSQVPACPQNVISEFSNAPVTLNRSNSNVDNPETKIIRATSLIDWEGADLTDSGLDAIDASKAPASDTLTLKNSSGAEVARKQANRRTTPDGVAYTANFDNINPGTYQLCSVVADKCIPAIKKSSEILNIVIEAPRGKYDIRADESTSEQAQSCTERMGLSAGWIVCGILELVSDGITSLFDIADSLLNVDGQNLYDSSELRAIWSYFRIVATFALIIIGLVMVISQAIGGGL